MKLLMVATLLLSSITGTAVPCCCEDEKVADSCHGELATEHVETEPEDHHGPAGHCENSCCAYITLGSFFHFHVQHSVAGVSARLFPLPLGHPPEVCPPPPRIAPPLSA